MNYKEKQNILKISIIALIFLISSCMSVGKLFEDTQYKGESAAYLIFIRMYNSNDKIKLYTIKVDNVNIATIGQNDFFYLAIKPGLKNISIEENGNGVVKKAIKLENDQVEIISLEYAASGLQFNSIYTEVAYLRMFRMSNLNIENKELAFQLAYNKIKSFSSENNHRSIVELEKIQFEVQQIYDEIDQQIMETKYNLAQALADQRSNAIKQQNNTNTNLALSYVIAAIGYTTSITIYQLTLTQLNDQKNAAYKVKQQIAYEFSIAQRLAKSEVEEKGEKEKIQESGEIYLDFQIPYGSSSLSNSTTGSIGTDTNSGYVTELRRQLENAEKTLKFAEENYDWAVEHNTGVGSASLFLQQARQHVEECKQRLRECQ